MKLPEYNGAKLMTNTDGLNLLNKLMLLFGKANITKILTVAVMFSAAGLCNAQKNELNVILLIGDGMGVGAVSISDHSMDNSPFRKFPTVGLVNTRCADSVITDSGAGVTAIATGHTTNWKYLGNDPEGKPLQNIFEFIKPMGYATGIITTSTVTDATPAGFVAHFNSRYKYFEIAEAFVDSGVDVVIGGGTKKFVPEEMGGQRKDGINLIPRIQQNGYLFFDEWDQLEKQSPTQKFFALLEYDELPQAEDRDYSLGDVTNVALNNLSKNKTGFFLMVEGSKIDDAGHANNAKLLKNELEDFNTAVNAALNFAEADGNTLVIVTADHETGGVAIFYGDQKIKELDVRFSHHDHTGNLIAIFSCGPGSENFGGVMDNDEMGQKLFNLFSNYAD
ncbi:alkaline phosphatase [Bacteroidota bacterium]